MMPNYSEAVIERYKLLFTSEQYLLLIAHTENDYKKLSETYVVPLGTIKSRINRARTVIARALAEDKHPNGALKWSRDGETFLDDKGNRSIFDDVDE